MKRREVLKGLAANSFVSAALLRSTSLASISGRRKSADSRQSSIICSRDTPSEANNSAERSDVLLKRGYVAIKDL